MSQKIVAIPRKQSMPKLKRVAAYARVSSGKDAMKHSLFAQVSYFSSYIHAHPGWECVGVYADEAKTGTKDDREQFQRLLTDCRSGKIDLVMVKSISRLARNTVTLLATVRELRNLGVDVFFEEQNIYSSDMEGELLLTILASFAQEESRSVSENMKWRVKRKFEAGQPWGCTLLGYRNLNGQFVIEPSEAITVRRIFIEYLSGKGATAIANELNEEGILTRFGCEWRKNAVIRVLRNYTYTGNLLLQKYVQEDYLTKRKALNMGQMPKYHAAETHEAIVDLATYEAVQSELDRRIEKYAPSESKPKNHYPFTGLIVCAHCGKHYRRKVTHGAVMWVCPTYNNKGKKYCPSKQIPEAVLYTLSSAFDLSAVDSISAMDGNNLRFYFKDGTETVEHWETRSRSESWTAEMRAQARKAEIARRAQNV